MDWTDIATNTDMELAFPAWMDGLGQAVGIILFVVVMAMLAVAAYCGWCHAARRRFWCPLLRREVETEFAARGLRLVAVRRCSAFAGGVPTCGRRCVAAAFRRRWDPPLPVLSHASRQAS